MRILATLCIIILSFSACKNSKKAQASNQDKKTIQAERAQDDVSSQNDDGMLQQAEPTEGEIMLKQIESNLKDSVYARIRRSACFGRCPIYTLTVYESGYVEYLGEKWVDKEGRFAAQVDQSIMDQLMSEAKAINFFSLNHIYDSKSVTDLPSTIVSMKNGKDFYTVVGRYQTPEEFTEFAKKFDALFENIEWKQISID